MEYSRQYQRYKQLVEQRLSHLVEGRKPRSLYDPIRYILRARGKRVRPVLTLLACEAVGGRSVQALDAAVAIEVLHGFTLVHDDIMDNAETRRGLKTIHKKWDQNTAILAGDEMVALAYQSLLRTRAARLPDVVQVFTEAFNSVCEGQGLDGEFEHKRRVRIDDYMRMIDKKTAAILSAASAIGAMIGGGTRTEIDLLRAYGRYLGIAFQIQDDLLDVVGEAGSFGKAIGSDLREGKRTYLLLKAWETVPRRERNLLREVLRRKKIRQANIKTMRRLFERNGVLADARVTVRRNTRRAQQVLDSLHVSPASASRAREMLHWFADALLRRTS